MTSKEQAGPTQDKAKPKLPTTVESAHGTAKPTLGYDAAGAPTDPGEVARLLSDRRFSVVQRQELASHIARTRGNKYFQRVIAQVNKPPSTVQRVIVTPALRATMKFRRFLEQAASHGLPTRFLRAVMRGVTITFGSEDQYGPWFNTLEITSETFRAVEDMSPGLPLGESTAIQTIYHEATHAMLDISSDEPEFARIIAAGERHYAGAPLAGGGTADDPSRIFQEAAASYVGHRVSTWYSALEMLSALAASEAPAERVLTMLDNTIEQYNRRMAERVFGYQETGGLLGFFTEQTETTRAMTDELKNFLDTRLLEGSIPDNFDSVPAFAPLVSRIRSRAGGTSGSPH